MAEVSQATQRHLQDVEYYVGWYRVAGLAVFTALLAFRPATLPVNAAVAWWILGVGWLYGVWVVAARPYRRVPALAASWTTVAGDAVFITAWIAATGGVASPYYLIWYLAITTVAFRFGPTETAVATTLYAASYVATAALTGGLAVHAYDVTLRVAFMMLAAASGAIMARVVRTTVEARGSADARAAEAEASVDRLRAVVAASPDAVAVLDGRGRFSWLNGRAADLFGVASNSVTARPLRAVFTHGAADRLTGMIDAVRPGDAAVFVDLPDGLTARPDRVLEVGVSALQVGTSQLVMLVLRDVTLRRRAEEQDREVTRLRDQHEARRRFVNAAAHELSTPLTPILTQLHLLDASEHLNERDRRAVTILHRNLKRLTGLVDDLVASARDDGSGRDIEDAVVDVTAVVRETVESFEPAAAAHDITLTADVKAGLRTRGDAARLAQVFFNLVANAIKFTPDGGSVRVVASHTASAVRVTVQDTGPGVPDDEAAAIFEPFHRAANANGHDGSGLGLYIARTIIDLHGGTMSLEAEGDGATFHVDLPPWRETAPGAVDLVPTQKQRP